jgi:hypothetical protein
MSIKAMTWAFELPLEPRAKIALLAIADNARDDGVAWPSRDTIAAKSSQSRATVGRRVKYLVEHGVISVHQRFREDGTQTTDEIHLNLTLTPDELARRLDSSRVDDADDVGGDDESGADGGGCQADTLGSHSCNPGVAVVTGGGLHSCNPHNEPSLEPESPPSPPPGGSGPLSKEDREANEKRQTLWRRFLATYPGIATMDQQAAGDEFNRLALSDAEWAVAASGLYDTDCRKLRKPPKNAHLWLRKRMFGNFPRDATAAKASTSAYVRIDPSSVEGRAVIAVCTLARASRPFSSGDGKMNYRGEITPQLLALADAPPRDDWLKISDRQQLGAWGGFISKYVTTSRAPMETDDDGPFLRAPWSWPPRVDGTLCDDGQSGESE